MQTHSHPIVSLWSLLATSGLALYSRGTDQRTENTASFAETPLLGLPRDRHPASSLAH
jgi:hypothetical protein